jgi:hypothetical protein
MGIWGTNDFEIFHRKGILKMVCERLGIRKVETSVEHPQSDGLVEQMNRQVTEA